MKVAFMFSETKFLAKLTKFFTGCYCYHVAFVDERHDIMYDMNLIRRKRRWSTYKAGRDVVLVEAPAPMSITADYLEEQLLVDCNRYGVLDCILFVLRPLYHLVGKSTRNANGVICSEMVHNDLRAHGWNVHFREIPSPCDLYFVMAWDQPAK